MLTPVPWRTLCSARCGWAAQTLAGDLRRFERVHPHAIQQSQKLGLVCDALPSHARWLICAALQILCEGSTSPPDLHPGMGRSAH